MLIPLSIYFIVSSTAVFISALLAFFCLGERITYFEIFAMILAFSGITMISLAQENTEAENANSVSKSMF